MSQQLTLTTEPPEPRVFGRHCLPKTMKRAKAFEVDLGVTLVRLPKDWPFEDKVLVFLAPAFHDRVREYHEEEGKQLIDLYDRAHIHRMDEVIDSELELILAFAGKWFRSTVVSEILEDYRKLSGRRLIVASEIWSMLPKRVELKGDHVMRSDAAQLLIAETLLRQTAIIVTAIGEGCASVAFNDVLMKNIQNGTNL